MMKRERKEKEHQGRSIPRKCKVPLQSPFKLSLMEKIRGVEGLARENQNRPIYRAHYMHTRRDYVNFPPCHTVSSTFNYLYLLPFNGLIAFLSAIYRRATEQKVFRPLTPSSILDPWLTSRIRSRHSVNAPELTQKVLAPLPRFSHRSICLIGFRPSKTHPQGCLNPRPGQSSRAGNK